MLEWLLRVFNRCIVPQFKGKGDSLECANYRGITLLSAVGKVYEGILIEHIRICSEWALREEQCGFGEGF